jgi:hypothetical protein
MMRRVPATAAAVAVLQQRFMSVAAAKKKSAADESAEGKTTAKLVRNLRLDTVLQAAAKTDIVLAKQEGPSMFSFLAFTGLGSRGVVRRIFEIPESERHLHTVFGREGIACDLALDLDVQRCKEPKNHAGYYTGETILREVLDAVASHYTDVLGLTAPDVVVLDGHSDKKHSYHVHVRHSDAYFFDYLAARDAAAIINSNLSVKVVDLGTFRKRGMLRVAYTPKFTEPKRILLPFVAQDAALKVMTKAMREMSEAQILERSLITNTATTDSMKVIKTKQGKSATEYDEFGAVIPKFLLENKKWQRYGEAVASVKRMPPQASEDYNVWIRVGLALHSFGHEPHILALWKDMSARCRSKYNPQVNENLWEMFAKRPHCYNWRRGYNYLMHTAQGQLRR